MAIVEDNDVREHLEFCLLNILRLLPALGFKGFILVSRVGSAALNFLNESHMTEQSALCLSIYLSIYGVCAEEDYTKFGRQPSASFHSASLNASGKKGNRSEEDFQVKPTKGGLID
jgi:hypothetical protein